MKTSSPNNKYLGNLIRKLIAAVCVGSAMICLTFVASGKEKRTEHKQTLTYSKDKKYLLDTKGNKVKQYLESAKAFVPMTVKDKSGHEFNPSDSTKSNCHPCNCHRECIRWDEHGHCNGWYNTCDICC